MYTCEKPGGFSVEKKNQEEEIDSVIQAKAKKKVFTIRWKEQRSFFCQI